MATRKLMVAIEKTKRRKTNLCKSMDTINSLNNILQNILFCVQQTKETHKGLELERE